MISVGGARTAPPTPPAAAHTVALSIAGDGAIFFGTSRIEDDKLPMMLRAIMTRDRDAQLVLHVDRSVPHARVIFVIDQAKQAGLTRIALATGD
jgi:biopolymer transport protein ExbD